MKDVITSIRRLLINFGKSIPFILTFVVLVAYMECFIALLTNDIIIYEDFAIPNCPISYSIASMFEYDWLTIIATTILCFATETCKWNKLGIFYLALQLVFKNFIANFELEPTTIYAICVVNILVAWFITHKGITILLK